MLLFDNNPYGRVLKMETLPLQKSNYCLIILKVFSVPVSLTFKK